MATGPFVGAYFQRRRVDETDAGDVAAAARHEVGKHRDRHAAEVLDEAIVAGEAGKLVLQLHFAIIRYFGLM